VLVMSEPGWIVVNGAAHETVADAADTSLLLWLREDMGLTGTKYACGESECGACSVLVDGLLTRSCVTPVGDVLGRSVTTIEGLVADGRLHPVQRSFVDSEAMQCGFCTPGMVVAAVALLETTPHPSDEEIARWMRPNLCRCCTYPRIVDAVRRAAGPADRAEPAAQKVARDAPVRARPRVPWDRVEASERDYFDVLGDGLVVVVPPPASASGRWSPTGGAWLHVDAAGEVTAFTGKVNVGQGTRRALRIAVAAELGVQLDAVQLVMGDTDVCPFDMGTFGSMSMPFAAPDLRRAAAAARVILRDAPVTTGMRRVEVVAGDVELTPSNEWSVTVVGHRDDGVAAVTGGKVFTSDVRRPGMLHGRVLRPPALGSQLRAVDVSAARAIPGVAVVAEEGFVGVAAATRPLAQQALDAIVAEWDGTESIAEADLEAHLRSHPVNADGWGGAFAHDAGDVDAALANATVDIEQTYTTAYVAHAPLETRVAVAEWEAGRLTVWTGTQQPFNVRRAIADALAVSETHVRVIVPDTGSGFGGKHDPATAIAAARLARAAAAPVRLQWSREEEFTWAYFRPAAVIDVRVGATSDDDLVAWEHANVNAGNAGIGIPYEVANVRLRFQPAASPLRQGAYRALAATANTFARESCIDELAHELRMDPLELRLCNLDDDRLAVVLRAAAERFGWDALVQEAGTGAGVAVGAEKGGRVATCALVRVDGDVEVVRVVTAFECGAVIDADNLRNQVEGATLMGLSGALFEHVGFGGGQVLNPRFSQYRVARFTDVPVVDVVLVDRPDLPAAGGGETPIIAIAPALANAIFAATGRRIRSLPLLGSS
jgi:isoquinoline 1-oxidoreductase